MKYLTFNELRAKLGGRGRSTIYRDVDAKRLPPPVRLGGRNYWPEEEVDAALQRLAGLRDLGGAGSREGAA